MDNKNEESIIRITPEECPEPPRRLLPLIRIGKQEVSRIAITRWVTITRNKVFFYSKAIGVGIAASILPGVIFGYVMGITGATNKLAACLTVIIGFFTTLSVKAVMKGQRGKSTVLIGCISTIVGLLIGIYVCARKIEKELIEIVLDSDNGLRLITLGSAILGIYLGLIFKRMGRVPLVRVPSEPTIEPVPTEVETNISLSPRGTGDTSVQDITMTTPEISCPICREILISEDIYACSSCRTQHHTKCWEYNGGCGVFGCPENPSGH